MSLGPDIATIAQFPGPARFVRDIVADLDIGKSVVVVFPDVLVDNGVAHAVLAEIALENSRAHQCESSSDSFPCRILATFGSDPGSLQAFGEWDTIIRWEAWHQSWVLISAWEHSDVIEILDRWPAQVKACGLSERDCPKLVVGLRLADVARSKLLHLEQLTVAVHWWWGVLDRLDTETWLAAIAPREGLGPVDIAVITELSGWDLACVGFLVDHWDRTTDGISEALESYRALVGENADDCTSSMAAALPRSLAGPPVELEEHWRNAKVEKWGHSIKDSPVTMSDAEISKRAWIAHNRILMPHVDDERGRYETMVRRRLRADVIADVVRGDDIIEIGQLKRLVDDRVVDLGKKERLRLQFFGRLRNKLAHREPIDDQSLKQACNYLGF